MSAQFCTCERGRPRGPPWDDGADGGLCAHCEAVADGDTDDDLEAMMQDGEPEIVAPTRWVFSHCRACAENDEGTGPRDPGVGCSADGPCDGCEAVWIRL